MNPFTIFISDKDVATQTQEEEAPVGTEGRITEEVELASAASVFDLAYDVNQLGQELHIKGDLYAYDRDGTLLSTQIQSGGKLQTGLQWVIIDQVDPFNYSVLVTYLSMGRALSYYEEYVFNDISSAISFSSGTEYYAGLKLIREGEFVDEKNYIKNPEAATVSDGSWNFLDKKNYAVNDNGQLVKFHKTKAYDTGMDYDVLFNVENDQKTESEKNILRSHSDIQNRKGHPHLFRLVQGKEGENKIIIRRGGCCISLRSLFLSYFFNI